MPGSQTAQTAPTRAAKSKWKAPKGSKSKVKTKSDTSPPASPGVVVGGTLMTPQKDLVENAVNSTEHTLLVSTLRASGLIETLKSAGPYTLFAPTNAAFDKLPAGVVSSLMVPEHKQRIRNMLAYHVVPGRLLAADLQPGQKLTTVAGGTLTIVREGSKLLLRDARGGTATITTADIISRNGVIHVLDAVLLPAK